MGGAEMDDLADLSSLDDLSGKLGRGILDIVEAGHGDATAGLRDPGHLRGFARGAAQGLFADHVLARLQGRHGHVRVQEGGRGDGDRLHVFRRQQIAPVACSKPKSRARRCAPAAFDVAMTRLIARSGISYTVETCDSAMA